MKTLKRKLSPYSVLNSNRPTEEELRKERNKRRKIRKQCLKAMKQANKEGR